MFKGNAVLSHELARRLESQNITSNGVNPGNLRTELTRHHGALFNLLIVSQVDGFGGSAQPCSSTYLGHHGLPGSHGSSDTTLRGDLSGDERRYGLVVYPLGSSRKDRSCVKGSRARGEVVGVDRGAAQRPFVTPYGLLNSH